MKNKLTRILLFIMLPAVLILIAGCSGTQQTPDPGIEDGTYVASFTTDNSMFHVNETNQDRGILTVQDGKMTIRLAAEKTGLAVYGPRFGRMPFAPHLRF